MDVKVNAIRCMFCVTFGLCIIYWLCYSHVHQRDDSFERDRKEAEDIHNINCESSGNAEKCIHRGPRNIAHEGIASPKSMTLPDVPQPATIETISSTEIHETPVDVKETTSKFPATTQGQHQVSAKRAKMTSKDNEILQEGDPTWIWMRRKEKEYNDVRNRIAEVCKKYGRLLRRKNFLKEMMVDEVHGLNYCRIGKVGTTTWLEHFLRLSRMPEQIKVLYSGNSKMLHNILPNQFKPPRYLRYNEFNDFLERQELTSFVFVRHPFERLVSAYRDKIQRSTATDANFGWARRKIQQLYGQVNFTSFLQFVIEGAPCTVGSCKTDVHWQPFFDRCALCDVHYDIFGRMENFHEDVKYILLKNNLTTAIPLEHSNLRSHSSDANNLYSDYFANVPRRLIQMLYRMYEIDFLMFGYSTKPYL